MKIKEKKAHFLQLKTTEICILFFFPRNLFANAKSNRLMRMSEKRP